MYSTSLAWVCAVGCFFVACQGGDAPEHGGRDEGDEFARVGEGDSPGSGDSAPTPASPRPTPGTPLSEAAVYWVGHSLLDGTDSRVDGGMNVMNLVGHFARNRNDDYDMYPHIRIGAPLSSNYYWRAPEHLPEIREAGGDYDVLVMTEAIPLGAQVQWNATHFFARRFFCAARAANPSMRVLLYETWHHLHASDPEGDYPPPHRWDWRERLAEDLPKWEAIADAAGTGEGVTRPDSYDWPGPGADPAGDCTARGSVHIVPAGQALGVLYDRLRHPHEGDDWGGLDIDALFFNGYRDWPSDWPVSAEEADAIDPEAVIEGLERYDPSAPPDDIHLSALGAYYVGLVHYATVYRRSPVGLPGANGVPASLVRPLQELAWDVVLRYPRSGVTEEP